MEFILSHLILTLMLLNPLCSWRYFVFCVVYSAKTSILLIIHLYIKVIVRVIFPVSLLQSLHEIQVKPSLGLPQGLQATHLGVVRGL